MATQDEAQAAQALAEEELVADDVHWDAFEGQAKATGYVAMTRRLPRLIAHALRLSWQASPRDTVAAIVGGLAAAILTAFGLLATNGALESLLASAPTRERVDDAIPSLVALGAIITLRASVNLVVRWFQERLNPQVELAATVSLFSALGEVDLAAMDDPTFHDHVQRASERGVSSAGRMVSVVIGILGAFFGLIAVAGTLALLHPLLLPLVLIAAIPPAWGSIRYAREGYALYSGLAGLHRRERVVRQLMVGREPAAEQRAGGYLYLRDICCARRAAAPRERRLRRCRHGARRAAGGPGHHEHADELDQRRVRRGALRLGLPDAPRRARAGA
jgi:ATP-binding cassette subfamily B protein/ATP-binding cassette subfamily C protein